MLVFFSFLLAHSFLPFSFSFTFARSQIHNHYRRLVDVDTMRRERQKEEKLYTHTMFMLKSHLIHSAYYFYTTSSEIDPQNKHYAFFTAQMN